MRMTHELATRCAMALLEGWGRFEDDRLEQNHPLLTPSQWGGALARSGFEPFASFPPADSAQQSLGQHVMLAGRA
jgi:hypothetical protein